MWLDLLSEVADADRYLALTIDARLPHPPCSSPGMLTRPPAFPAKWYFLVKTRSVLPRQQKPHAIGYLVTYVLAAPFASLIRTQRQLDLRGGAPRRILERLRRRSLARLGVLSG